MNLCFEINWNQLYYKSMCKSVQILRKFHYSIYWSNEFLLSNKYYHKYSVCLKNQLFFARFYCKVHCNNPQKGLADNKLLIEDKIELLQF